MTSFRTTPSRRAAALAAFAVAAAALVALAGPAGARLQSEMTVTTDPTLVMFDPMPDSAQNATLAVSPDPDDCKTFAFCDTIPLRIPIPDVGPGDDYKVILSLEWDQTHQMEIHLWDNKQIKDTFGAPEPGDNGYEPKESEYTRISSTTDPANEDISYGQPDLVEYNLVVINTAGTNTGYGIHGVVTTEQFTPPPEKLPPPPAPTGGSGGFSATLGEAPGSSFGSGAGQTTVGVGESSSVLGDVDAISDPDLIAIREDNLEQALAAPTPLSTGPVEVGPPPEPPSGLILVFWVGVVPTALIGGAGTLLLRRRRLVLAFG